MLHIHQSNRAEELLAALAQLLAAPPAGALTPERVVTSSHGMGRWLALELAASQGVAANLEFVLPAAFIWRVLQAQLPEASGARGLDRETLLWRCMATLPAHLHEDLFDELRLYLQGADAPLKSYQLCRRIADVFDRYSIYRPEWLQAWERTGSAEHWQTPLWRTLAAGQMHRARLIESFHALMRRGGLRREGLPERVSVFGLSALAPAYLDALAAVAAQVDVHVFVLNPCAAYWGDIVTPRAQARAVQQQGDLFASYLEVGNPLLAAWGGLGRAFVEQLQDYAGQEHEYFVAPPQTQMLGQIQHDLLTLETPEPAARVLAPSDASVQVHVCHSPMREVEVLHDRLLDLFETLPDLRPRDIVVMTPDISTYAPYVEAVFGNAAHERHIPWSLADRAPDELHSLIAVFLSVLGLPQWRHEASQVLTLLEVPALRRRFALGERDVALVRAWVRDSGVRFGLDGAARAAAGLPAAEANTWAFGLRRLFLGYAMPDESAGVVLGSVPMRGIEGGEAQALGYLQTLIATLESYGARLRDSRDVSAWQETLNALLDALFAPEEEDELDAVQAVRDALDTWVQEAGAAGFAAPLPAEVVREHLERQLGRPGGPGGFLSGGVTFCTLVPMRAIPFRVACLIGMGDEAYPRRARAPGFDLMEQQPRRGDPSAREEDRYLFLEALLSARDRLYLSYVGRDARDNSPRPPSLLVSELLDYVEAGWRSAQGTPLGQLVLEHPLQPFSPRYYGGDARWYSYAEQWLGAAAALDQGPTGPGAAPAFAPLPEPVPEQREVDLDGLVRFLKDPARGFLQTRLAVRLPREEAALEDAEPFALDQLEAYQLRSELLEGLLAGADPAAQAQQLRAEGRLPADGFGERALQREAAPVQAMAEALRPMLPLPPIPVEVDLSLGGFRLTGWLGRVGAGGQVLYRCGKVRPQDALELWLRHLALCAAAPAALVCESRYVGVDEVMQLAPIGAHEAQAHLSDLLALYWQGLCEPLPLRADWSLACAQGIADGGEPEAVRRALVGERDAAERFDRGARDAWGALAWVQRDLLLDARFPELAQRVFGPLLAAGRWERLADASA